MPMSPEQLQALRQQMEGGQSAATPQEQLEAMQRQQAMQAQHAQQMTGMQEQSPQPLTETEQVPPPQYSSQVPPQAQPTQPMQQQRPMTAQEAMRARMQAGRNQQAQPTQQTVMTQGEQYSPAQQPAPIDQTQAPNGQSVAANNTIINTTQTEDDGGSSKGFKMNPVMAIGIAIVVLLLIFFGYSYLSKNTPDNPDESEQQSNYDPFEDPNIEWVIPDQSLDYTMTEIQQLRAAGYTGDEIESYAAQHVPYADLIKEAEAARDAYIQQAIAPLYDTASDEYKRFVSQTWLTLPKRTDADEWKNIAMNYAERRNLDYEKIDVYGNQLFIKIYLDDNLHEDWFFCQVTPEEWNRLGPAGNIIVNYTYCRRLVGDDMWTAVEDMEHIFIISASIEFVN